MTGSNQTPGADDSLTERGLTLAMAIVQLLMARDEDPQVVAMALCWLMADLTCQVERRGYCSHADALLSLERQALELAPLLANGGPLARRIM